MKRIVISLLLLLVTAVSAPAATWFLEPDGTGDAPHMQAAIDSSAPGDTILLNNGVFTGAGNQFLVVSKTLSFLSVNGPEFTRINFSNTPGFTISAPQCLIEGIAHDGASAFHFGGGILVESADFTLRNCWFVDCGALAGAGVAFFGASGQGRIMNCEFRNCGASLGSAVAVFDGMDEVLFEKCLITACADGPVAIQSGACVVRSTTFWGNAAFGGKGSAVSFGGPLVVENCVVANSHGTFEGPFYSEGSNTLTISCSDMFGNTAGGANADWTDEAAPFENINDNFSEDPLFCDEDFGIFTLSANSPCAPGNHPTGAACDLIGAYDVDCGGATRTEESSWSDFKGMFR